LARHETSIEGWTKTLGIACPPKEGQAPYNEIRKYVFVSSSEGVEDGFVSRMDKNTQTTKKCHPKLSGISNCIIIV
jgi:hypothetical protein